MLPFARMVNYGNIIPKDNIIKIETTNTNSVLILSSDGKLYGFGSNSSGELGTGDTARVSTPVLIDTGVSNVWGGLSSTLYRKGNDFYTAGDSTFYGPSTVTNLTFVNITSHFNSINSSLIKKICLNAGLFVLMQSGDLYCSGVNNSNQFGDGTAVSVRKSTLTLTQSSVLDIKTIQNASFILKNDNRMYSAGTNGYGQLGVNSPSGLSTVSTYTAITKFSNVSSLDNLGTTNSTVYYNDNGTVYGTGRGGAYQMGNGSQQDINTLFSVLVPVPSGFYGFIDTYTAANSPIVCCSDGFYASGNNPYGVYGTGTNVTLTQFTRMSTMDNYISNYSTKPVMKACLYGGYFASGELLYAAGNGNTGNIPGYSGVQRSFVKIEYK